MPSEPGPGAEPGQNDSFLMSIYRTTFFYHLPWKQVCRKAVLIPLLAPLWLYGLHLMGDSMLDVYAKAVAENLSTFDTLMRCGSVFLALSFVFAFESLNLIFIATCFWQLVLWIKAFIEALPAIWAGTCSAARATWKWLGSATSATWQGLCATGRFLRNVPTTIANSTLEERTTFCFMTASLALLGVICYFGWGPASYVWGKISFIMPGSASAFENFVFTMMFDMVGSMFVWSLLLQILVVPVARRIVAYMRSRHN